MSTKSHQEQINAMIQRVRADDPYLGDILRLITGDLHNIITEVNPIQEYFSVQSTAAITPPTDVASFTYSFSGTAINFSWSASTGAVFYEIREGTVWDSATFILRTASLGAAINPRVSNTYNFLIKAINSSSVFSANAVLLQVIVPDIGTPSLSGSVIDNNVLLSWTIPSHTFNLDHYNVYRNGVKFAEITGNFITRFEITSGDYNYSVEAVDIAGETSPSTTVALTVRQPPDYELLDEFTSSFAGTKTNCTIVGSGLVACVDLAETFETHFTSKGWADPQAQVTAGYDYFIQDNLLTGSYVEEIDYGATQNNTIVNLSYFKDIFSGTGDVTVTVKMATKLLAGDPYSADTNGTSQFFASFRYLRITLEFAAANDDSMIILSALKVTLDVKKEVDSGVVSALAADSAGTVVNFSKTFRDVDSITAETQSIQPADALVDFTDIPNPTSFKILVFDGKGQRINATVYWKARGIV